MAGWRSRCILAVCNAVLDWLHMGGKWLFGISQTGGQVVPPSHKCCWAGGSCKSLSMGQQGLDDAGVVLLLLLQVRKGLLVSQIYGWPGGSSA